MDERPIHPLMQPRLSVACEYAFRAERHECARDWCRCGCHDDQTYLPLTGWTGSTEQIGHGE